LLHLPHRSITESKRKAPPSLKRSPGKIGQRVKLDRMLDHKSIPEIIKAANKKGSKNLTPADAAEAISTKYGPTVPKELTQKEIDDLADYLVKIYPDRR
jgi:hypothetical protein